MNAVIFSFDPNVKQSVICERKQFKYEMYGSSRRPTVKHGTDCGMDSFHGLTGSESMF